MMKSERGSALVLTLLFIMLLTTMSTAMYLYATRQSMFADSKYTQIAATYVADAGIERGKGLLIQQDMMLNTFGQNPGDGIISRDDYPVILPISENIGRYDTTGTGERITDNKQGVGTYSLRIDAAFSEIVDFDVSLERDVGFNPAALTYGAGSSINRILPGKIVKLLVRQGIEVVDKYEISYLDEGIQINQLSGSTSYNPIDIANIINPFLGDDITIELNRTDINTLGTSDFNSKDAWGNRLVLFPNNHGPGNPNLLRYINGNYLGANSKFFYVRSNASFAAYIMKIENLDYVNQNDITITLHYTLAGVPQSTVVCNASHWSGSTDGVLYAMFDFSYDGDPCRFWTTDSTLPPVAGVTGIRMEISSPGGNWVPQSLGGGINVTLTRGIPGEIRMGLRMRTEGMEMGCWWPEYPDCGSSSNYEPVITLPENSSSATYNLTPEMMNLGHHSRISVNELYTITSTGNVEDASESRELQVSPVSFLDYARFTQTRLTLAPGSMFAGKVYCQARIELPPTGPGSDVYFFDDVITSSQIINPGSAKFPLNSGELIENYPLIEFPELDDVRRFYVNNSGNAWVIGSSHNLREYDLFLGNYDYVKTAVENKFWGLDFSNTPAVYREPDADILNSESYSYRTGWTPGALGPNTTTLPPNFNGLIIVNGDCHVWGTLHGQSVSIVARGDIIIEREIIMGTDDLDPLSPEAAMSTKEGMPVHLNMLPLRYTPGNYDGDFLLSKNCPRIMRVESGLMAFAGALTTEDNDWDPSNLDADNSHPYAFPVMAPGANYYNWTTTSTWNTGTPYDLNDDGRLTDGLDFNTDELPRIELGAWNEKYIRSSEDIWYLMLIGPFIDRDGSAAGHFAVRGTMNIPGGRNGTTRNYRYDPSIRINAPPFVPVPENSLKIMDWDPEVYDLPN